MIKPTIMNKGRLETFSDGVFAIIITIMVLELKIPKHEPGQTDVVRADSLQALKGLLPVLICYVLSFVNLAIYWNNHHHMMHAVQHVNGAVLWANIHLLFWLSLVPFATAWMGENNFTTWPVVIYGVIFLMAGIAYYFLAHSLVRIHGRDSKFARALGSDRKGKISILIYAGAIGFCFMNPWIGFILYALVAAMWFVPDRRFEKTE
jgi:uncharacterized membrane protein